jgi:Right handed beta helix region
LYSIDRILGLTTALLASAALAAGADGSWTSCAKPARLQPDWSARLFHVATWGTDPGWCPGNGYTFRTIPAAAKCAKGRDTIYVHGGTYGPVLLMNLWPSDRVLITNAPGESPVIDGWGGVKDYGSVLGLWRVGNFAIQGLEVRNTGVPDSEHGGYGINVSESSSIKLYYNTVHDTARHGIITDGSSMEIVGNEVYNTVMRNQYWQSDYWDAAVSSKPTKNQWSWKLIGNSIHDSYGECADVLAVDGATVEGNRIYNCVSVNLFVSNSRNVTINRNWIYANTDKYNRKDLGYRATGIQLANESTWVGWSLKTIRITNNIVEWVGQGLRYWRAHSGGSVTDTYGSLYVGFNDFNRTKFSPIRFDTPEWGWPSSNSRLRQNIVLNSSGWSWFSTGEWGAWNVDKNKSYDWNWSTYNPGINDTWGTYTWAYKWRSGAWQRWTVAPWSEWDMPAEDYHCSDRDQNEWNSPGAIN